ncbi:MAG: hypothetical protein JO002_08250, partial [Burkholderiaceae bacterium]|nr:hypothetical protein [Burkholderiaceae bacterium]
MEAENKVPAGTEDADLQSKIAIVRNLLADEPFVEGVGLNQNLGRKDLLEALARRQNRARLSRVMRQFSPRMIAKILDAIPGDEAFQAWNEVSEHQREDVLRYINKALRAELMGFDAAKPNEPRLS